MKIKIVAIVGARPQFIKAAAVSRAIRSEYADQITEVLVHTGQHYDDNMSRVFFDDLDIPKPKYNLAIIATRHGEMTGRMLERIESILLAERPDWVLVYGDTNSTLAGALAAIKLHMRVAHVEAGLRSFNMKMPEEVNRILTDRISSLLFCPSGYSVANLASEGITKGVYNVGDVMYDTSLFYGQKAEMVSHILEILSLIKGSFILATCHRAENTDNRERLSQILSGLANVSKSIPVIFPLHPRTRKIISSHGLESTLGDVTVIEPLPYLDMLRLEAAARLVVTDSGGVQKEAYFFGIPCVTLREETEWIETIQAGWNRLVRANSEEIAHNILTFSNPLNRPHFYGDGRAAYRIVNLISKQQ